MTKTDKTDKPKINHGLPPWQWMNPETGEITPFTASVHGTDETTFDRLPLHKQEQHRPNLAEWRRRQDEAFANVKAEEARKQELMRLQNEAQGLSTAEGYERLKLRLEAIEARLHILEDAR